MLIIGLEGKNMGPRKRVRVRNSLCFLFLLMCAFQASAQVGAAYTVSDEFTADTPQLFELSQDESMVVFRADPDEDGQSSLYSVSTAGGEQLELSPALVEGGAVLRFRISSNSDWVVYLADQEVDGKYELYAVPIQGGDVIKLSTGAVHNVEAFDISPNGDRVVYSHAPITGAPALYSVPISGGDSVLLNSPSILSNQNLDFKISPNGQTVVYRDDQDNPGDFRELYSVPIEGGAAVKISQTLVVPSFDSVNRYIVSPNSQYVVFEGAFSMENKVGLFSVPINGGSVIDLNPPESVGSGQIEDFQISADSARVVYNLYVSAWSTLNLYSVPIHTSGGSIESLNPPLTDGGEILGFSITSDGSQVVYSADLETDEAFRLYRVPIEGGTNIPLTPAYSETNGSTPSPMLSPDGNYALYAVGESGFHNLYQVPVSGGEPTKLNSELALGGTIKFGRISNDSSRVIYIADRLADNRNEVFFVSILGGAVTQPIMPNAGSYFAGYGARFSSNDNYVVFDAAPVEDVDYLEIFVQKMRDDELCVPIKTTNGSVAVICL